MKERPILFSDAMVRAILAGKKTQTRRVLADQPMLDRMQHCMTGPGDAGWVQNDDGCTWRYDAKRGTPSGQHALCGPYRCPYGVVGDRLWVRECAGEIERKGAKVLVYRADEPIEQPARWRPSIHCRRSWSRILLEIVDVRVERLHDISERDARAEGVRFDAAIDPLDADATRPVPLAESAIDHFRALWNLINGNRDGGSWDVNPWVWAITFRRVSQV